MEKANYFLQFIMDNGDKEHDERIVQHFLKEPVSDGGTTNGTQFN